MRPTTSPLGSNVALLALCLASLTGCGARTELDVSEPPTQPSHPACPGSPTIPTRLATLDVPTHDGPAALVVAGGYAYVGLWDQGSAGALVRVPLAGGATEVLATDYDHSPLAADAGHVYFFPSTPAAPNGATSHTRVHAIDVTTKIESELPFPALPAGSFLTNGLATSTAGMHYLEANQSGGSQSTLLEHWSGTQSSTVATLPLFGSDVVVGETQAFVLGGQASGDYYQDEGLYRVPLSGGAPVALRSFVTYEAPMLIGALGDEVFYTPDGVSIRRASASSDALVTDLAYVNHCGSSITTCQHRGVWLDDRFVYFVQEASIERVGIDGSNRETLVANMAPRPAEIASDACNVYFVADAVDQSEPPSLWAIAR